MTPLSSAPTKVMPVAHHHADRRLEIALPDTGVEAYVFTFG
jgi:hypothetical protein